MILCEFSLERSCLLGKAPLRAAKVTLTERKSSLTQ